MAKQGMKRPERTHTKQRNEQEPVPELQGKAKSGKEKAGPVHDGIGSFSQMIRGAERPISGAYSTIDTDLARDNLENDIPAADLEDL